MAENTKTHPLYYSIKTDIKNKIKNGEYADGDMLPTERALCEAYNVSRVTVRKAIEELLEENVLERSFGKTAVVRAGHVQRDINKLSGLYDELKEAGILCSTYTLSNEVVYAGDKMAEKFGIEKGSKLVKICRIRYADGEPLCYQKCYINAKFCPELENTDLSSASLYQTLEKKYGLKITSAVQNISACMASYKIAALLKIKQEPMLKVKRTAYLENKECIELSYSYYIAGRYALTMTLNN